MDSDGEGFHEGSLTKGDVLGELHAKVLGEDVVLCESPVVRWGSCEFHIGAEIILPPFTSSAVSARDTWLESDTVSDSDGGDGRAGLDDDSCRLVAEDHGRVDDEVADAAVLPVVHIGTADTGNFYLDEDVAVMFEFGDRSVFEGYGVGLLEDEGEVLYGIRVSIHIDQGFIG